MTEEIRQLFHEMAIGGSDLFTPDIYSNHGDSSFPIIHKVGTVGI